MNDSDYDLVYRYLNEEMPPQELKEFEERIVREPDLKQEVEFNRDLVKGMQLAADEELRASIKQAHTQFVQGNSQNKDSAQGGNGNIRRLNFQRYFALAAAVLILISITYFLYWPKSSSPQNIYSSYYEKDSIILTDQLDILSLQGMAIKDKDRKDSLKIALELYQTGNYSGAVSKLNSHIKQYPEDEVAVLFYGLSLMETGDFEKAIAQLKQLSNNPESIHKDAARWYVGLAYLQTNTEEAKNTFREISKDINSDFQDRAAKILEIL